MALEMCFIYYAATGTWFSIIAWLWFLVVDLELIKVNVLFKLDMRMNFILEEWNDFVSIHDDKSAYTSVGLIYIITLNGKKFQTKTSFFSLPR